MVDWYSKDTKTLGYIFEFVQQNSEMIVDDNSALGLYNFIQYVRTCLRRWNQNKKQNTNWVENLRWQNLNDEEDSNWFII